MVFFLIKFAYAKVSTRKQSRDGRSPIDPKRKKFAAHIILNQHYSYKQAERLTGLSVSTIVRAVRAVRSKNILNEKKN